MSHHTVPFSTVSGLSTCSWGWAWTKNCMFCLLTFPIRWKCASSLKKIRSRKLGWSSIRQLMLWQNASLSALFAAVWACRIYILYRNMWRSWCIILITDVLDRSVSCNKRLVDFLGDIAKCSLTLSMLGSVLGDLSCPLWPLFLSWTTPVSLNLFKRCRIVTLIGAFLPGKSLQNCLCLDEWLSCEIGLYDLDPLLHRISSCWIHCYLETKI